MKTLSKAIIVALSCFCAVDLVFIQSYFFISCISLHRNYHLLGPNDCDASVQFLQFMFGLAADIGIGAIVGISAIYSPKKSAILVAVTGSLSVLFIVLANTLLPYFHPIPPGVMRPMTRTEMMVLTVMRSPLWWVMLYASIISAIVWAVVVLRKKMKGLLQ